MTEKARINRSSVYFVVGILLIVGGMIRVTLTILSPIKSDFQMIMVVASMLAIGLGIGILLGLLVKMIRRNQSRLSLNDEQKLARKVRAQRLALGPSVIAMGTCLQVLSFPAHNPVAKLLIIGSSSFVMTVGIVIAVTGIVEARKPKGAKGR